MVGLRADDSPAPQRLRGLRRASPQAARRTDGEGFTAHATHRGPCRATLDSSSRAPARSWLRSRAEAVPRSTRLVRPRPRVSRAAFSNGESSRGVKPDTCSAFQKRLLGWANWWATAPDTARDWCLRRACRGRARRRPGPPLPGRDQLLPGGPPRHSLGARHDVNRSYGRQSPRAGAPRSTACWLATDLGHEGATWHQPNHRSRRQVRRSRRLAMWWPW